MFIYAYQTKILGNKKPAAIAGGTLNGLTNMSSATYQIENTDLYEINKDGWRIKVPDNSKRGFRKFYQYLMGKHHFK